MNDEVLFLRISDSSSPRSIALQAADARAHAARVAHRRRRTRDEQQTKRLYPNLALRSRHDGHICGDFGLQQPSGNGQGLKNAQNQDVTIPVPYEINSPLSVLSQYRRNPFNNDPMRNLPIVVNELMEFGTSYRIIEILFE